MDSEINTDQQNQEYSLKDLIAKGKEQGYLTYSEVNDHLPNSIVDPEQIEDIISMINDMGIRVHEQAPDEESLLLSETAASADDLAEEAAAALASVDSEFGRTTDPVRMYMREMGTVNLLTREGEIKIAKRIEEGLSQVLFAIGHYPRSIETLLQCYTQKLKQKKCVLLILFQALSTLMLKKKFPHLRSSTKQLQQEKMPMTDSDDDEDSEAESEEEIDTGPDPRRSQEHFEKASKTLQNFTNSKCTKKPEKSSSST